VIIAARDCGNIAAARANLQMLQPDEKIPDLLRHGQLVAVSI
jgi:hypothetical protein